MPGKARIAALGLALFFIPLANASTTGANATETKVTWRPEPKERGTVGILSNSFFILLVCIWTVIHDDVILNGTLFSRLLSKVQWMLYAFVAPEAVVLSAYKQWKEAKDLHKEFCDFCGVDQGGVGDSLGLEGAFFVVMGGFSHEPMNSLGKYSGLVTGKDFMEIIRRRDSRSVPKAVNKRLIADRGKADAIGKPLALTQAFSLVIQCLLRKIQGLTVTLLEFHVIIQVLCAAVVYYFWWSKPQRVVEPILISNGTDGESTHIEGVDSPPTACLA